MYATIAWSASLNWYTIDIFPAALTAHISVNAIWTVILMVYVFIASVLPVHVLLQPRDFINAWQLLVAMALLLGAILYVHPPIVADAVRMHPEPSRLGTPAPPMFPFLFITVACGAISGYHCLVSSGCSSRQLKSESDAKPIGYGSMLTEGFLATLVIIACVAGIGLGDGGSNVSGHELWSQYYAQWGGDAGLGNNLAPFITGSANMIEQLGIGHAFAIAIMGVFVASFAATTLDSATRLQRYIIAELAGASIKRSKSTPIRTAIQNRYGATTIATLSALSLALSDIPTRGLANAGLGGLSLWPVFGATNQLLAAIALLVVAVWLVRSKRRAIVCALPMIFMLAVTACGLVLLIRNFTEQGNTLLMVIALIMLAMEIWIVFEAALLVPRIKKTNAPAQAEAL